MQKTWKMSWLMVVLMAMVITPWAHAQNDVSPVPVPDPEQIAEECAEHITRKANHAVGQIGNVTERCINRIGELLEDGEIERAHRLARRCGHHINGIARRHTHAIRRLTRRCVRVLTELGAPELAERVVGVAKGQAAHIAEARKRARAAIAEQF